MIDSPSGLRAGLFKMNAQQELKDLGILSNIDVVNVGFATWVRRVPYQLKLSMATKAGQGSQLRPARRLQSFISGLTL